MHQPCSPTGLVLLAAGMLWLAGTLTVAAAEAAPAPVTWLLNSSFDAGTDAAWAPVNGRWYVKDGSYCETTDGNIPYWSVAGTGAWSDYDVSFAMKALDSGGTLFVAARWQDPANHYRIEYHGRGDSLELCRVLRGERAVLARRVQVVDIGGGSNPFAQFRFVLAGPLLRVFVGEQCLLQATDATFDRGGIALGELQRRGVWDAVRVQAVPRPSAAEIASQSPLVRRITPMTSFIRGRRVVLRHTLTNPGALPMEAIEFSVRLVGVMEKRQPVAVLKPGESITLEFPFDTALIRSGDYALTTVVTRADLPVYRNVDTITILPVPNPERLEVINWTGLDPEIESHGFTATWFGPVVAPEYAQPGRVPPLPAGDPAALAATHDEYDKTLRKGMLSGFQVHNIAGPRTEDTTPVDYSSVDAAGKTTASVNPNHPALLGWGEAWMQGVMRHYAEFEGLRFINLNSEWDRGFDYSPETVALYRQAFAGAEPPRFSFPAQRAAIPAEHQPQNGLIAADNPYYQYLIWWWREGQGWTRFNARMAEVIRQIRPDILTISEPTARIPALYGKARGCDIAQDWSYAFPSPRSILYTLDFLVATQKHVQQKISHDVQFLWKKGWVGPEDMCPSADVIRECMWMNLSRPLDCLFIWGTFLAIPDATDPQQTHNAAAYAAFRDFSETVIVPFGPMIRKCAPVHRPVAVLDSAASRLFVKGNQWAPGLHTMHLYDALQAARIPTDLILDEDVRLGRLRERGYRAVILSYCQTLPRDVHAEIAAFAQSGGCVIADSFLEAEIPGCVRLDLDFGPYAACRYADAAAGKTDADRAAAALKVNAGRLQQALAGHVPAEVSSAPETELLYNVLDARGRRLFVFINDRRTYGEWAGRYRVLHDAGVRQNCKLTIAARPDETVFYDLRQHREIAVTRTAGQQVTFSREFAPGDGTYILGYPERLANLELTAAPGPGKTSPVTVRLRVLTAAGVPVAGLQPLRVQVRDGSGVLTEYGRYGCAEDGEYTFTFTPAVNEAGGDWRLDAQELTAGLSATAFVAVPRAPAQFQERRARADGQPADLEHWDRD